METQRKTPWQAYGVECGPGWRRLYEPLLKLCDLYGVEVMQVKEKFGGLRFYVNGTSDLDDLIVAAERQSLRTCEDCGENGQTYNSEKNVHEPKATTGRSRTSGWIRTLCASCREQWDAKREQEAKKR
jgi:hypothetical protein